MSECMGLDARDYNTRTAHLLETKKNAKKLLLIGGTHKDGCYGQYRFRYIPSHNEYLITYKISVETSRAVVLAGVYEGHA